ncbi:unnamed protein product [Cuscuta campestris]|uniref:CCHC-type domain-containing protein n=1 Tax=Cuscuta campestris TaxID=132261 RepID=A0A484M4M5_9ASTE|nr:unnamed protein product [Cuscuta campestris]
MRIFIQSNNFLLWRIIKNGEEVPTKKVGETIVHKTEDEYDERDIKKIENNAKAINIIYCAVNPDDYRKISCCSTAKEMWDKLEITYEADAIQESIGITSVTIDGLRGNLKTYESTILYPSLGEQKKNGIALKASTSQERDVKDSSDKDEFGVVLQKFYKFMRKEFERKGKKQGEPPKCYGCGEVGHIKPKCPNTKNEKKPFKKHRAYISWGGDSGDESSEGEENESANLCLVAHEESPEEVCTTSKDSYTFDDVQEAFNELYDEYVNASKINKDLKKQLTSMEKEVDNLSKDNEKLKEENKFFGKRSAGKLESSKCCSSPSLKQQVAKLEGTLKKFGVSHKNLNDILDNLQLTKHGLGGQRKRSRTGKNVASASTPPPPAHKYFDGSFLWFNDRAEATQFSEKFEHREILPPRFSTARFIHDSIPREARIILERGNFLDLLYIKKAHYQPFLPRKFNHTALSQEDTKMLHAMIHNANINLCKFVMTHMFNATSDNRPLPYALLVMAILDEFHINTDIGQKCKGTKHWEIDDSSFHSGTNETPFRQPRPRRQPRATASTNTSLAEQMAALTATLSRIDTNVSQMAQNVNILSRELHGYFDFVNYPYAQMVPYAPPPNFGNEPNGTNC